MILGPGLTRARLIISKTLVEQWAGDVPAYATLWTTEERKQLPKMLVIMEEWD
jgi:hypothetical protein